MSKRFRRNLVGLSLTSMLIASGATNAATAIPAAAASDGPVVLLSELVFNSTNLSAPGWVFGAQRGGAISVQPTASPISNSSTVYALEGSYPAPGAGGQFIWADYKLPTSATEDIYIEFWAKMPGVKEGCKFLKIFGQRLTPTNYADTTIFTDYTGVDYGAVRQIGFGDGTHLINDSQNVVMINGTNPTWIGRSFGNAVVQTPQMSNFASSDWGTGWHHFRIHVKFNTGTTAQNEVPDGEFYIEIDGKVYVNATGLFNRNPSNGPIDHIEFFGWAQTESQPFQVWYDDIRISTGGFTSDPSPMPPADLMVK